MARMIMLTRKLGGTMEYEVEVAINPDHITLVEPHAPGSGVYVGKLLVEVKEDYKTVVGRIIGAVGVD